MHEIAQNPLAFLDVDFYEKLVNESGYLQFMETILKGVNNALKSILYETKNVLVHCSDGWDRTG
jgi:protein tyrosine phosphatase